MWMIFVDGKLVAQCGDGEFVETVQQIRQQDGELTTRWVPAELDQVITVLNLFGTDGETTARMIQRYMADADSDFDFDEVIKWMEMLRDGDEI